MVKFLLSILSDFGLVPPSFEARLASLEGWLGKSLTRFEAFAVDIDRIDKDIVLLTHKSHDLSSFHEKLKLSTVSCYSSIAELQAFIDQSIMYNAKNVQLFSSLRTELDDLCEKRIADLDSIHTLCAPFVKFETLKNYVSNISLYMSRRECDDRVYAEISFAHSLKT